MSNLSLHIQSADKVLFSGEVESLTSKNEQGEFDVLPMHENFISIIHTQIAYKPAKKPSVKLDIEQAILHINNNEVKIFLDLGK